MGNRLQNKVAIITGGAGGIGEASCLRFAEEGAKVVVADYKLEPAQKVADKIIANGGEALAIEVNVTDHASVEEMVQKTISTYGRVDILVNNAGITEDAQLKKMEDWQWHKVIDTNQTGVYYCTRSVIEHMIAQNYGRIINTSSIVGTNGNFGQINYAATKAALIAMAKTGSKEVGKHNITMNAVAPGFIRTPMTAKMPEKVLQGMAEKVPMKHLGEALDVANAYLFLASDEACYINGITLPVDGGLEI